MAVGSGSMTTQRQTKSYKNTKNQDTKLQDENVAVVAKRNSAPGVRVKGGRIYDSTNGKTCHQCRQKTRDFTAACKAQKNNKPCTILFCHKCLLNRYGEKAEEVESLEEWSCPKCRSICNCSVCMKRKGCEPTGILINTAKRTGYSSVSEMLIKGGERPNRGKIVTNIVTSPKKVGKENYFDGKVDTNLPNAGDKKSKKVKKTSAKRKVYSEEKNDTVGIATEPGVDGVKSKSKKVKKTSEKRKAYSEEKNDTVTIAKEPGVDGVKSKSKKIKLDVSNEMNSGKHDKMVMKTRVNGADEKSKKLRKDKLIEKYDATESRKSPRKFKTSDQMTNGESNLNFGVDLEKKVNRMIEVTEEDNSTFENNKRKKEDSDTSNGSYVLKQPNTDSFEEISLPVGSQLTSVAGIDLCSEDVGNALQLSEFCTVFGKALDLKKGQAEYVLRDIFHGRSGRRGKFSTTVQFHIHLLTMLKNEEGEDYPQMSSSGKNSWFNVLKESLSESQSVLKAQGLDFLDNLADYETLDATQKLRLLNILCDEVLETEKLRAWIEDENTKHAESAKEMKQKLAAARDEERSLKQKMKDDIAAAIIAKNGAALLIAEHDAIVSRIKSETEKAHAKVLESKGIFSNNNQKPDAVRVKPILMWRGYAYWKLNLSDKTDVLCQNVGKGDENLILNEEWTTIDDEGKNAIEKHVCSLRGKRPTAPRPHKFAQSSTFSGFKRCSEDQPTAVVLN